MALPRLLFFGTLTFVCGLAAAFFTFFGVQLVYAALTFDGNGSLGHVGMFIAAGLYPLLALIFAACTYLAWRQARKSSHSPPID